MAQAAIGSCSRYSNFIVQVIIWVLTAVDSISRSILYIWHRLLVAPGKARPGGRNPPAPKTLGIIITEPSTADISIRQVARLATWCMSFGAQQIHLYDPAGHLKSSSAVLQDSLQTLADEEGGTFVLKCSWPVGTPGGSTACPKQEQGWKAAAALDAGSLEQQCLGTPEQYQQHQGEGDATPLSTDPALGNAAVTVRLLSSEDAYGPVIAAAQRRCAFAQKLPCTCTSQVDNEPGQQHRCYLHSNGSCSMNSSCLHSTSTAHTCFQHSPESSAVQMNCNGCEQQQPSAMSTQQERALKLGYGGERQENGTYCNGLRQCQQQLASGATAAPTVGTGSGAQLSICHLEHQHQSKQPPLRNGHTSEVGMRHGALANGVPRLNGVYNQEEHRLGKQDVRNDVLHDHQQQQAAQQSGGLAPLPSQQRQNPTPQKPDTGGCGVPQEGRALQKQEGSILPELAELVGPDVLLEPELLLVFGPVLSLAGYPPFHTRACEVQYMGCLLKASRQSVANAIACYCKVLQRHGA